MPENRLPRSVAAVTAREVEGQPEQPEKRSSREIYDQWYELYYLLSTLELDRSDVRQSPQILERLRAAGWQITPEGVDLYWHRVQWTASHCRGRVLEIGAGMGNVTRWIAANPSVNRVVATDLQDRYVRTLEEFAFDGVTALATNVCEDSGPLSEFGPFDTVVLGEFIEHIGFDDEMALRNALRPHLAPDAVWVITTPIGFMEDPDHQRGFGRRLFRVRSRLLYGPMIASGDNRMQQFACCRQEQVADTRLRLRVAFARLLDWAFVTRPSGHPWIAFSALARIFRQNRQRLQRGFAKLR
jgi:2-polyprenyl-3-methyl-5-hydroxy-6-metoxy-1,4-benzoquinol methylase